MKIIKLDKLIQYIESSNEKNKLLANALKVELKIPERSLPNFNKYIKEFVMMGNEFLEDLETLNLRIENIRETMKEHGVSSEEYRILLKQEITLLDQKKEILEKQSKELSKINQENSKEIVIDNEELVAFISDGIMQMDRNLTKYEMILAVLDLEFEFLKSKGVIEE